MKKDRSWKIILVLILITTLFSQGIPVSAAALPEGESSVDIAEEIQQTETETVGEELTTDDAQESVEEAAPEVSSDTESQPKDAREPDAESVPDTEAALEREIASQESEETSSAYDDDTIFALGYEPVEYEMNVEGVTTGESLQEALDGIVEDDEPGFSSDIFGTPVSELSETAQLPRYPAQATDEAMLDFLKASYPATRNQNPFGTCWAHSAISLAELDMIKQGNATPAVDYSEMHLAYFARNNPNGLGDTGDTIDTLEDYMVGGSLLNATEALFKYRGVADESTAPYPTGSIYGPLDDATATEDAVHIRNYYVLNINENPGLVKEAIVQNGGVGISFCADNSLSGATNASHYNATTNAWYYPNQDKQNHAVTIVGWNDSFSRENFATDPGVDGAWLVRNSWSTTTEMKFTSYFWMSYGDQSLYKSASATVFEVTSAATDGIDNNYYYDGLVYGPVKLDGVNTFANVFTVQGSAGADRESLKAVVLRTAQSGVEYTVKIYKNLPDGTDPRSGDLVDEATTSGTLPYEGAYTIDLASEVELERGTQFSVVVTTENGSVCLERQYSNETSSHIVAREGESFFYLNDQWNDVSQQSLGSGIGNLCIQALTADAPLAPGELAAPVVTVSPVESASDAISVQWEEVEGSTSYTVLMSDSADGDYAEPERFAADQDGLGGTVSELSPGTCYYFKVKATNETQEKTSTVKSAWTMLPAVTGLSANVNNQKVTLSWDEVPGAVGYLINQDGVLKGNAITTSWTSDKLSVGTYTFQVVPTRVSKQSGQGIPAELTVEVTIPVTEITVSSDKGTTVFVGDTLSLRATLKPEDATNKNVSWTVSGNSLTRNNDPTTATEPLSLTAETLGKTTVTVASDDGNHKAESAIVVAEPIQSLSCAVRTASQVYLTWQGAPSALGGIQGGYAVYRADTVDGDYDKVGKASSRCAFSDTRITPGRTYYYKIYKTVDTAGQKDILENSASESLGVVVPPRSTGIISAVGDEAEGKTEVTWNAAAGATGYRLSYYVYSGSTFVKDNSKIEYIENAVQATVPWYSDSIYGLTVTSYVEILGEKIYAEESEIYSIYPQGLETPEILSAEAVTTVADTVAIRWGELSGNPMFTVLVGDSQNGTYTEAANFTADADGLGGKVSGLTAGTEYFFKVRASAGQLEKTSEAVAAWTILPAVTNLTAEFSEQQVTVTWDAIPVAAGYLISQNGVAMGSVRDTNWISTMLAPGTYTYQVVPIRDYGEKGQGLLATCSVTIPSGIRLSGLDSAYDYTGYAIKPVFRVYDGTTLLTEKTDYTVAYKNNTKAYTAGAEDAGFDPKKAPQVVVTLKGNYKGTLTEYFKITQVSLDGSAISVPELAVLGTTKAQTPLPVVTFLTVNNGKEARLTLRKNTDYTVAYRSASDEEELDKVQNMGDYYVVIAAKDGGNYKGKREVKLTVADPGTKLLLSKATVKADQSSYRIPTPGALVTPNYTLTGKIGKESVTLIPGEDYTVVCTGNDRIGTATAVITALDSGRAVGSRTVTFKIIGESMSGAAIVPDSGWKATMDYEESGEMTQPATAVAKLTKKVAGKAVTLEEGTDYTVSYLNHTKVGTATVVFTGNGTTWTGTMKKTYRITAHDLNARSDENRTLKVTYLPGNEEKTIQYQKGGVTFTEEQLVLTIGSTTLKPGTDYRVTYKNNTKVADKEDKKAPSFTIIGKGNYTGTYAPSSPLTFSITAKDISLASISAADKNFSAAAGGYQSAPVLYDTNGKKLVANTDYTIVKYELLSDSGAEVLWETDRKDKGKLAEKDVYIRVTVRGKNNYDSDTVNSTTYHIVDAAYNLSKATVQLSTSKAYKTNGEAVTLTGDDLIVTMLALSRGEPKRELSAQTDAAADGYMIVEDSYTNNTKSGTASVTLRGTGQYGGTKVVKFKVTQKTTE